MKKIIMAIMAGILLMGCATTSGTMGRGTGNEEIFGKSLDKQVHAPVITREDLGRITKQSTDFTSLETTLSDFSVRIVNKTNEDLHLGLMTKDTGYSRWFYLHILPNETKEFSIPDVIKLNESYMAIRHPNPEKFTIMSTGAHFSPTVREIIKTHSLEFIYDNCDPVIDTKTGYSDYSMAFDWSFIEPFECNNTVKEIEWDDLDKILKAHSK